uniref:Luciferin 4-monooxygenase n=1 Tax=Timema genevievae TaxID=629358 RepID=A0A7R9JPT8_TIMGE|nr:unnamed protein product [Timema genevievae]
MPTATLVDLVTSVPGGENVDEDNIEEWLECDASELGFERLIDIEITNKAMGVNENEEQSESEEDEAPARMTHETALHHVDGLLQYLGEQNDDPHLAEKLMLRKVDAVSGVKTTFSEVLRKSTSLAESLRSHGVGVNDVVVVASENSLEFCLPVLAAYYLGATCATFNPLYTVRELRHALNISKPIIIFCSPNCVSKIEEASEGLLFVRTLVVQGDGTPMSSRQVPFHSFLRHEAAADFAAVDVDPEQHVAAIMCSSGTTGLPKGVMLTDRNIVACITNLADNRFGQLNSYNTQLAVLPFFHAYAYVCQLASLTIGFRVIVLPKFEEELLLKSIQDHKVTLLFLVPTLLVFLGKSPKVDLYDLSSVKEIWCGAAPLSKEVQDQVTNRLKIRNVRQGYGLTETTLAVTFISGGRNKYGSCGTIAPGMTAKVVDLETGKPLGPNCSGELCFKGPLLMKGYLGDLQATSATMDDDGFLRTGDVGYYDQEGYFFIVERVKELIKYKSFQVPPAELEAILLTHPSVQDAAVIGIPDEMSGELPMAFIVKQPGAIITSEMVTRFVAGESMCPLRRDSTGVLSSSMRSPRPLAGRYCDENCVSATINAVTGESVTFSEVLKKSLSVAATLRRRGLWPRDRLAVMSENHLDFFLPVLGSYFLGVACATISPAYTPRELLHALNITQPPVLFCSPACVLTVKKVAKQATFVKLIVVFGEDTSHGYVPLSAFLDGGDIPFTASNPNHEANYITNVLCTSGTTGLPKGASITDRNLFANLFERGFGKLDPDHVMLGVVPYVHVFGLILQLQCFSHGLTVVVMPRFQEKLFLESIQRYKVSFLSLVPTLMVFLAKSPLVDQYDLSSLKEIWCGAAPLGPDIQARVTARLGVKHIQQGYGSTELMTALHVPFGRDKPGSTGVLAPGTHCKILDLVTGKTVGPNKEGELCFKGAQIMKGYYGDSKSTSECFDKEGYFHTGDVGYYDTDGYFFIVDRIKELIKYKAFQVAPAELEAILLKHPSIEDAAVVGVPDEVSGELPKAFVVKKQGVDVTEEEIVKFVAGNTTLKLLILKFLRPFSPLFYPHLSHVDRSSVAAQEIARRGYICRLHPKDFKWENIAKRVEGFNKVKIVASIFFYAKIYNIYKLQLKTSNSQIFQKFLFFLNSLLSLDLFQTQESKLESKILKIIVSKAFTHPQKDN